MAILFSLGRLPEALAAHEKALEVDPRWSHAHQSRAHTLAWLGRCDEAATGFRKASELAPLTSSAIITWAHLNAFYYTCPDHYDLTKAFRHAESAYEADPERRRELLAIALFLKGDYTEAKRTYLELFEENPENVWFNLAMCHWHLGEKIEARRFFDESVAWQEERLPDSPHLNRQRQEAAELLGVSD